MNCKNNSSCCSPYSILAQQLEETNNRAIAAYNLAVQGLRNPVNENLTINGDLLVNGDIFQYGAAYETHAEKVYTNDDYIIMRDGAVSGLAAGDYSGFQVTKYDGTNDGRLVIDRDGTARVGDVNDEQPLATRDESINLVGGHLLKWDAAELKLIDAGVSPRELGMHLLTEITGTVNVTYPNQRSTTSISLPAGVSFEKGYDYLIMMYTAPSSADVGVRLVNDIALDGDTSFGIYYNSGESEFDYRADIYIAPATHTSNPTDIRLYMAAPSRMEMQEKLVSGTNIKTVGGVSLLGSGDVPAGGLTWTKRTANNDWTDMFEWNGTTLTAKKHIWMWYTFTMAVYIPKGFTNNSNTFEIPLIDISGNNSVLSIKRGIKIQGTRLPSTYTEFTLDMRSITFTTDGSTVTLTDVNQSGGAYAKNLFTVFVAD